MVQTERLGRYHVPATDLVVRAPAREVWKVLSDFSAVDTWVPFVISSHIKSYKDRGVGVERHCKLDGQLGEIDEITTAWEEGCSLSYRVSALGPLLYTQNTWTIREIDQTSCRVVLEIAYDMRFGVFGRLFNFFVLGRVLRKRAPGALVQLQTRVETGELVRHRRSAPDKPQRTPATA